MWTDLLSLNLSQNCLGIPFFTINVESSSQDIWSEIVVHDSVIDLSLT